MSTPSDVPVVCTKSGLVLVVDSIDAELFEPTLTTSGIRQYFIDKGVEARVRGRGCVACGQASCEYRPLRGPLFVPR